MEWSAPGIVLGTRRHSEADVILEVMTAEHGRHLGLVRGGRSRRQQPVLQPGNEVQLTWRARLQDHLGMFTVELVKPRAAEMMASAVALNGVQHLAFLLRLVPERHANSRLFNALELVLEHLNQADIAAPLMVRFELELLQELGFGLDLTSCAATGRTDDLAYVSPKSSRAVSRDAGRPYHDKLLPLPSFLVEGQRQSGSEISFTDIAEGFRLTSYFLERHVLAPRAIAAKDNRSALVGALEKHYRLEQPWNFIDSP
ncbi:DNA repair protein RecO [Roseibium sp.]|uniref:DNA repair protein RecO n=1 Tax=Roseibium sp. TaxID=1936156 RepID=UPI003A988204